MRFVSLKSARQVASLESGGPLCQSRSITIAQLLAHFGRNTENEEDNRNGWNRSGVIVATAKNISQCRAVLRYAVVIRFSVHLVFHCYGEYMNIDSDTLAL